MPATFSRGGWSGGLRQLFHAHHHPHPEPQMSSYVQASTPTILSSPVAGQGRRREPRPHTHLLDALQSVIGLLDVPVHRIHSDRFTGFYPRAMNVVQPVKRGEWESVGLCQACQPQSHSLAPTLTCWPQWLPPGSRALCEPWWPLPLAALRWREELWAQPLLPMLSSGELHLLKAGGTPECSSW